MGNNIRDIKFRVFINYKSGVSKMEYDGYYLDQDGFLTYTEHYGDDHDCGGSSDSLAYLNDHKYIVMLYIGIKDINKKEIYEDDIVKVDDIYIGVIKYDNASFYFESKDDAINGSWIHIFDNKLHKLEVIGNIYENKELLDASNEIYC